MRNGLLGIFIQHETVPGRTLEAKQVLSSQILPKLCSAWGVLAQVECINKIPFVTKLMDLSPHSTDVNPVP